LLEAELALQRGRAEGVLAKLKLADKETPPPDLQTQHLGTWAGAWRLFGVDKASS